MVLALSPLHRTFKALAGAFDEGLIDAEGQPNMPRAAKAPTRHGKDQLFLEEFAKFKVINRGLGKDVKGPFRFDKLKPGLPQDLTKEITSPFIDLDIDHLFHTGRGQTLGQGRGVDKAQDPIGQDKSGH